MKNAITDTFRFVSAAAILKQFNVSKGEVNRMPAVFQIRSKEEHTIAIHDVFHFENKYLNSVKSILNDWIIYYQPARRAGERGGRAAGYFATARVVSIYSTADGSGYSTANLAEFCEFPSVPFSIASAEATNKFYYEQNMRESDGSLNKHANQQRVRLVSIAEYNLIMDAALGAYDFADKRDSPPLPYSGFAEDAPEPLLRSRFVTSRALRDRAFSKAVGDAYGWRCAMTGIALIAPDGSHEIECAHIKPVKDSGPDTVRNGIPLLRTFHWLLDKGFVSVDFDYRIIKSSLYDDPRIDSLINKSGRIFLPKNEIEYPHPDFLDYHREHIFKS